MLGLPEGKHCRVEIAGVSGIAASQGKQFLKQELRR